MTGAVLVNPRVKFTNSAGVPIVGGTVTVYLAGTTTLATTYQDKDLRTANNSTITLDANGECLLWVDSANTYKILLKDLTGATVSGYPVDNVPGTSDVASIAAAAAAASLAAQTAAEDARDDAETYAAAAATGAKFYDTIALGNAAVANAATFGVIAGGSDGLTRASVYRRESAGVSTLLYAVLPASEYDAQFPVYSGVSPVWAMTDELGNTAMELASDGTLSIAEAVIPTINGFSVRASLRPTNAGTFDGELVFLNNSGQSLAGGPATPLTTTQEYDNVGYTAGSSSPGAYSSLTSANCSSGGVLEPPLFGALYYIKVLLDAENGLAYTDHKYQLVGGDNSQGSLSILALNKGDALYNAAISQATSTTTIAATNKLIPLAGGVFWTQGEADSAMSAATYQGHLSTLATDYNTDLKAATGQTKDIAFITYQTGSATANRNVALGQLAASIANPLVHLACAMYVFNYTDAQHVDAESSKWLGCYYGLVYKRVMIDGTTWSPIRPISSIKSGSFANVKFSVPVKPLVLDTTQVPSQSQSGFTLVTSADVDIPITSVTVVAPDTVKIIANTTIPAGAKLRYGYSAATGKSLYVGAAGNLRDSQGDSVPMFLTHRMDNWCVIFEYSL
jgi:hypothetical protein